MNNKNNKLLAIVFVVMALLSGFIEVLYSEETIVLHADYSQPRPTMIPLPTNTPTPTPNPVKIMAEDNHNAMYIFNRFNKEFSEAVALEALVVSYRESRWNTQAVNNQNNKPEGSIDRGIWQINNYWHSNISDSCAYDLECSTDYAIKLYNSWSGWGAWVASDKLDNLEDITQ